MHYVLLDAGGEIGADGSGGRLLRVGRAHDVAVALNRVLAFEHLHHHGSRGHVPHQVLVERALAVHGIERLGLRLREMLHAAGDDA